MRVFVGARSGILLAAMLGPPACFVGASGSGAADASTSGGGAETGDSTGGGATGVTTGGATGDGTAADATSAMTGATSAAENPGGGTTAGLPDDCPRVRVIVGPGQVLNIRADPSTAHPPIGTLPHGAIVDAVARVHGEVVEGLDEWFEITSGEGDGFVWAGLVECTLDEPPELEPPGAFWLPLECETSALVSQGNFGEFSHQGTAVYAFDFALALGTPLVAIADGVVQTALFQTMPGDPCYDGGGPECGGKENLVTLLHGDGTTSTYVHLGEVSVGEGEFVPRGAVVGLTGSTGWSTGPHAHVQRQENCGWGFCQSIPVAFADVPGDGVPVTGQTVTSMNCP